MMVWCMIDQQTGYLTEEKNIEEKQRNEMM